VYTVHLSGSTKQAQTDLWIDPVDYHLIRIKVRFSNGYQAIADVQWLAPTPANLALLNVTVPSGFTVTRLPSRTDLDRSMFRISCHQRGACPPSMFTAEVPFCAAPRLRRPSFWRIVRRPSGCGTRQPQHRLSSAVLSTLQSGQAAPVLARVAAPESGMSGAANQRTGRPPLEPLTD
jgi:hypothetical protein